MPRDGSNIYSLPAGTVAVSGTPANSAHVNSRFADLETDQNTVRPIVAGGTGSSSAAAARTALGLAIGTNVQAYDADLAAIAALMSAADQTLYATGAGTWALTGLTAAGRALAGGANAAAQMTTLGISTYMQTLMPAADAGAAQTALGVSTFIKTLLPAADAPTARATLGAQPLSQTSAGVGQMQALAVPTSTALVLPAGGTWEYWFQGLSSGSPNGQGAGVAAGGTTLATANAGIAYIARCKRIA